jgi:hypothetical protein
MFDWFKTSKDAIEPLAHEFVIHLLPVSLLCALLAVAICAIYYAVQAIFWKETSGGSDTTFAKVLTKISAAFSLPIAPALALSTIYPELLAKIEGVEGPLIIAAVTLLWSSFQSFKQ